MANLFVDRIFSWGSVWRVVPMKRPLSIFFFLLILLACSPEERRFRKDCEKAVLEVGSTLVLFVPFASDEDAGHCWIRDQGILVDLWGRR